MLQAINTTSTSLTAGQLVPLTKKIQKGCTATLDSNTVSLNARGVYEVNVNVDYVVTDEGIATLQMYNNGVAIPDSKSSETATAGATIHQSFTTLIQNTCPAIKPNLTLTESVAGTTSNVSVVVTKLI